MWQEPKMDWLASEYFLLSDWQRIVNNAEYLYSFLDATFEWLPCDITSTSELPYYDIVNNLEQNLWQLSQVPSFVAIPFEATEWQPRTGAQYTHNPSYEDYNRWEVFEWNVYYWNTRFASQLNNLRSGNFTAGTDRLRQYFARRIN